jgi:hypothetical protein
MFNHCCLSGNIRTRFDTDSKKRIWFAGRDIVAGEELNACYIDQSSPVLLMDAKRRRRLLRATKLFECECMDCVSPLLEDFCGACKRPFAAGSLCGACGAPQDEVLDRHADRLFGLLCGEQLSALSDKQALEMLEHTTTLFGAFHWAKDALALSLLDRPDVFDAAGVLYVPALLFRRDGVRRLARIALLQSRQQLQRVIDTNYRRVALSSLAV